MTLPRRRPVGNFEDELAANSISEGGARVGGHDEGAGPGDHVVAEALLKVTGALASGAIVAESREALIPTPAASAAARASARVGRRGFQALSPERSMTLRSPANPFVSIRPTPWTIAAPMAAFPPTLVLNDYIAGYLAAAGAIAALRRRAAEGGSYHVHVNLARAAMCYASLDTFPSVDVGLLFIAMEDKPKRLRVNGTAEVVLDDPVLSRFEGAQALVRVTPVDIIPNCPRNIPQNIKGTSPAAPALSTEVVVEVVKRLVLNRKLDEPLLWWQLRHFDDAGRPIRFQNAALDFEKILFAACHNKHARR